MDKTIKINLAGTLFQIDEAAYHLLRDYLQSIDKKFRNVPGGNETIEDIESRIAEIFQSQQNLAGIISKENVEAMIGLIGNPDDFDQPGNQQEQPYRAQPKRRLYRNPDDKIISGVCSGIGAYVNMDPVWIRIIFILFALCFGVGFFVYIALCIALPKAYSDIQKRELYGNNYNFRDSVSARPEKDSFRSTTGSSKGEDSISRVGGAFNEVFRALGKFFFIVFRIIMIILGVAFVLIGFTAILALVLGLFFNYPGFISMGSLNANLFFLPDLLNCIVNPALTPWIMVLSFIVLVLPLIALIYWGIKMIFWFRVNDGIISLIFLVVWVMSITALSIILVKEGVSFSETGKTSTQEIFLTPQDTLYIIIDKKVKQLPVKREFSLPRNYYSVYMTDSDDKLSIRAHLRLSVTTDKLAKVEIMRQSSGHNRADAARKAESLIYGYRISKDTLFLDEYFTIPSGSKWSGDELSVTLYLPEKTILHFDNKCENMFTDHIFIDKVEDNNVIDTHIDIDTEPWELGNNYWVITDDGLKVTERAKFKQK
jgi:phage shock protein PspC (stress-responsive transcriptional regulator)